MAQKIEREDVSESDWQTIVRQAEILGPLAKGPKKRADVDRAALQLGISTSNAYRLIRLLAADLRPTALLPRPSGPQSGIGLLEPGIEAVISEVLEGSYCSSQKPKESAVLADIRRKCRAKGLTPPGRKAVHTRIHAIDLFTRLRSREGDNAAERTAPRPGGLVANAPNQIWLIDHTLADVILVDRRYRLPIGRPTLTLIIDAYTRMCVGCYVSLGAPSIIQTAMALLRAFMPKEALLESIGHDWPWQCHGFPQILHSDNGVDFKSVAIRRGLDTYGVAQDFRPVRQPRYGALIERFIGTLMGELHLVPGTTFSNVQQRGEYDSDRRAVMTLDAFETWVLLQISRYHRSPHRGIDSFTPQSRWEEAVAGGFEPRAVPPSYAEDVLLAFLPSAKRQLSRTGSWRVSCERHRSVLTELATAELVPVKIDGVREYRVRFVRDIDQVADPFRQARHRRGGRSGSLSVLGFCLERDICSALRGAPLPECWCLGTRWPAARAVLIDLADLLLSQARGSRERLIHRFASDDWIPQGQASQFAEGCFPLLGAFWQRRILESCARILIDPSVFQHLEDGRRLNVHAELAHGRIGQQKARSLLGSLATSDLMSLLFAYMGESQLTKLEPRMRRWPAPLAKRVAGAAAVALYIQ